MVFNQGEQDVRSQGIFIFIKILRGLPASLGERGLDAGITVGPADPSMQRLNGWVARRP